MTPWAAAGQASLSFTISQNLFKLMSIEWVMPSNHLILCCPLLLLPSILPTIRGFSNESVLCIRWPKYWSFSFSISPFNEYSGWFPLGFTDLISLQPKGLSRVVSSFMIRNQTRAPCTGNMKPYPLNHQESLKHCFRYVIYFIFP